MEIEQKKLNKEIGDRIRGQREFLEYTREELSEMADISTQFLADIEVGRKSMTAATIMKLSKALRISSDYLLFGEELFLNDSTKIEKASHQILLSMEQLPQHDIDNCIKILRAYLNAFSELYSNNKSSSDSE